MKRGKFIVLEGIDGSGKTTIGKAVARLLEEEGEQVHLTFEPTKYTVGSLLRQAITQQITLNEASIAALFVADRMDHIVNEEYGMLSYLEQGIHVISDRYYLSSYAYHVPHVSLDWVINANSICKDLLTPDLILYIDIDVATSLHRISHNRNTVDLFENEHRLTEVRNNYLNAIDKVSEVEHIITIDGTLEQEDVLRNTWHEIKKVIYF